MAYVKINTGKVLLILLLVGSVIYLLANLFLAVNGKDRFRTQTDEFRALGELAAMANGMADLTQRELELTAAFLDSGGSAYGDRLQRQRDETDRQLDELRGFLAGFEAGSGNSELADKLDRALAALTLLDPIRQQTNALAISAVEATLFYAEASQRFQALIHEIVLATPQPFCGC